MGFHIKAFYVVIARLKYLKAPLFFINNRHLSLCNLNLFSLNSSKRLLPSSSATEKMSMTVTALDGVQLRGGAEEKRPWLAHCSLVSSGVIWACISPSVYFWFPWLCRHNTNAEVRQMSSSVARPPCWSCTGRAAHINPNHCCGRGE